ncbi:MAG: undecaprenyldiphospho-muramoylpentapeptide beta-N-acetylglucosaminyltransferase [Candidatus Kapabacteria bacterium]|nr:undecaprenyldiphospho-muramoylpentapeptide beta-N-acetylglucosaminyltransferase [Candidatus Kapabacteria bacterium]
MAYFGGASSNECSPVTAIVAPPHTFRVVVAAGGTGGHIFPAVAVVEQLELLTNGACSTVFLGSTDRMEATLIPKLGYQFVPMPIVGYKGLALSTLSLPFNVLASIRIAREVIRKQKPHAVICTGAYVSYPVGIAAMLLRIPLIVLESNLNPGKTNSRLAHRARAVVLAFEESFDFYHEKLASKLHVLGNPVRTQINTEIPQGAARRHFGLKEDVATVLVFGGSLGARTINSEIERLLPTIAGRPWQMLWQTGKGFTPASSLPENVRVVPFLDDMGSAYAAADLIVARSGATTIAELGIVGKPAILVPLPSASTNEQQHNASVVAKNGGAVVVADGSLQESLLSTIDDIMNSPAQRTYMSMSMTALGKPNAAIDCAKLILKCGGWQGGLA